MSTRQAVHTRPTLRTRVRAYEPAATKRKKENDEQRRNATTLVCGERACINEYMKVARNEPFGPANTNSRGGTPTLGAIYGKCAVAVATAGAYMRLLRRDERASVDASSPAASICAAPSDVARFLATAARSLAVSSTICRSCGARQQRKRG